jgi:hypothetical protein
MWLVKHGVDGILASPATERDGKRIVGKRDLISAGLPSILIAIRFLFLLLWEEIPK